MHESKQKVSFVQIQKTFMTGDIQVSIIMGSISDLGIMEQAAETLQSMGIRYEITVVSAHRTPKRMFEFASTAADRGVKIIIAGAGGAAHLPGMAAALEYCMRGVGVPLAILVNPTANSLLPEIARLRSLRQSLPALAHRTLR